MAEPENGSTEVKFAGARALVKQRGDGLWIVRYREAGKGRNTTRTTKEAAMDAARGIVRDLAGKQGGKMLTVADAELVTRLKQVAGERSPFSVLEQIENAVKRLGGWEVLQSALQYYEMSGMAKVQREPFMRAKHRFLALYEKNSTLSRAGLRKELDAFDRDHKKMAVCEITLDLLTEWISRGGPGPKFRNNRLGTWKTFFNKARSWNYWPKGEKTPAELITKVKEPDRVPPIWTVATAQAIVDAVPIERLPYVVIGCWCGLRPFELLRIEWDVHFDWERRYIHVTPEVALKTMHERFVPIPDNAYEMLIHWKGESGKACIVHAREELSDLLRAQKIISGWPQDVMRHSSISYAIARGDGVGVVAEHHGNSERIIRKVYRRPLRQEDATAWYAVRRKA